MKQHVRFGGGPTEKDLRGNSPAAYPTTTAPMPGGSGRGPARAGGGQRRHRAAEYGHPGAETLALLARSRISPAPDRSGRERAGRERRPTAWRVVGRLPGSDDGPADQPGAKLGDAYQSRSLPVAKRRLYQAGPG